MTAVAVFNPNPPSGGEGWASLGMPCTDDCSGHGKGFAWGQRFNIMDVNYANGNSNSFNEGVRAYANAVRYAQWTQARGGGGVVPERRNWGSVASQGARAGEAVQEAQGWASWVAARAAAGL